MSDLVRSAIGKMVHQENRSFERDITDLLRQLRGEVERLNRTMAQINPGEQA